MQTGEKELSEVALVRTLRLDASKRPAEHGSMHLTLAQLQKLADDFDLGRVIQMDRPLTTQCNTTDPFRTGRGTFLLRARHSEEYGARVEYLHALIDHLCNRGFPVPQVVRARDGRSWTTWGERIVEIHKFVKHDPGVHRDWRRMNSAASVLGDLHGMLAEAAAGKTPVPPEMRNDVTPEQCWTLLSESESTVEAMSAVEPAARNAALSILRRARAALEPLLKDYPRIIGQLPWMTVHGDFHFWNVLYNGDEIAAVVDYDFMQERERLFDIAYAMQNVIAHLRTVHGGNKETITASELPWSNVRLWLDHYDMTTHLPLSEAERRWLPTEILRIFLVGVATGVLQEDPIEAILKQGSDLDLYLWVGAQERLFL
ncbi:MAG: phosphotransferase [Verrucomicrobia bacterium]|nr:phosphotransferase [Verrucomicrobiota bacterium]